MVRTIRGPEVSRRTLRQRPTRPHLPAFSRPGPQISTGLRNSTGIDRMVGCEPGCSHPQRSNRYKIMRQLTDPHWNHGGR